MDVKKLVNHGIAVINQNKKATSSPPIVIVGVARGGTSLVAGVLDHLGVFTGDRSNSPVFEDVALSNAFETGTDEEALEIINKYNASHKIWAWKRPSSLEYLGRVDNLLTKPRYIFIFKDLFSIVERNQISMGQAEYSARLKKALDDYGKIIDFIEKKEPYAMLVSYDKAKRYKEKFINEVVTFGNISADKERFKRAVDFIQDKPIEYLDATRVNKAHGAIGGINNGIVSGWAHYPNSERKPKIQIFVNDKLVATVVANQERAWAKERGFKDSLIGYSCDLKNIADIELKEGDLVRVKADESIADFSNSPVAYTAK